MLKKAKEKAAIVQKFKDIRKIKLISAERKLTMSADKLGKNAASSLITMQFDVGILFKA